MFKGFDVLINSLENPKEYYAKTKSALVEMTLKTVSNNDEDLLELMKYYNEAGILDQNEYLLAQLREYIDERFDIMKRETILNYCTFLKDIGMFFEDADMIQRLNKYFHANYYIFELSELFQLLKLNAYSFHQPENFMEMLLDTVAIRVKQPDQLEKLTFNDTLDFIEALSIGNRESKAMAGHLVKILKQTNHLKHD